MQRIHSLSDPRVAPYRNLRDRTLRGESIFLAEGELLAMRLLESDYEVESVLVSEAYAEKFQRAASGRCPVYVASESLLVEVVGFPFHRGALAAGRRRPSPSLDELVSRKGLSDPLSLAICPDVTKPENLGLVFRTAAAFGTDAVLLGRRCCDPLSRRALRLSMGGVLRVPWTRSENLADDLRALKEHWRVELVAAVLDDRAERLMDLRWPPRAGLLLGNEMDGLGDQWLVLCDRCVTIPMQPGTDSLNLGVAAGIFLYQMRMAVSAMSRGGSPAAGS
jgi:tRNA G18 (ribose-2'-O)-methylase SpoU